MPGLTHELRGWVDRWVPPVVPTALAQAETWAVDPPERYCPRCGVTLDGGSGAATGDCEHCAGRRYPWQRVTRLGPYADPLNHWLRDLKFHRRWVWAPWLGRQLAEAIPEPAGPGEVWVTAVPMPGVRRWQRGYNQSALMARALAKARGWAFVDLLRRTRHTPPQTAVAPSQRAQNVSLSVAAEPVDLAGQRVVLVDDILTTGATLRACARALRARGAEHCHVAVAAVAEPKDPGGYE